MCTRIFEESQREVKTIPDVGEVLCSCPDSGAVFKAAADSRVAVLQDLFIAYGLYTLALSYDPCNAKVWSNRSACAMHLRMGELALLDATNATKCDTKWAKGYVRQGDAYTSLCQFNNAVTSYKKALEIDPTNKIINDKLVNVLEKREALEVKASRQYATAQNDKIHEKSKKSSNCACM